MYTPSFGAFAPPTRGFPPSMPHGAPPSLPPPRMLIEARRGPGHFSPSVAPHAPMPSYARPVARPNRVLQDQIFKRNQEAFRQREIERLMRENRYTRDQALIAANASLTAQNAALRAQAAAQAAQPTMPAQPTAPVSPAQPTADLTPQQDASDGGESAPESVEPAPHHKSKLLLFGALAVAAGVGGYVLIKRKRAAGK